jgi:hypothetical protein
VNRRPRTVHSFIDATAETNWRSRLASISIESLRQALAYPARELLDHFAPVRPPRSIHRHRYACTLV